MDNMNNQQNDFNQFDNQFNEQPEKKEGGELVLGIIITVFCIAAVVGMVFLGTFLWDKFIP